MEDQNENIEVKEIITIENKCPAALLELRDAINKEGPDEGDASKNYSDMATKLNSLGEQNSAELLQLIAGQELLHKIIIEGIVDHITQSCGA